MNGLKHVESKLHLLGPALAASKQEMKRVDLKLPKFKIESSMNLVETLKNIGISDMFNPRANFSVMTDSPNFYVAKVLHQAKIAVSFSFFKTTNAPR